MNGKLSIASMAIMLSFSALVLLTISSSVVAQSIIVDGDGSDWDPSWFLAADATGEIGTNDTPYFENGYDVCGVWQHYNATEDTLYFRYDIVGIAGDSDNNSNPNTPFIPHDEYGVGTQEHYRVQLNTTYGGDAINHFDLMLYFNANTVTMFGHLAEYANGTAAINLTPPLFNHIVEFSIDNVSGWLLPNPYKYSLYGWANSGWDGLGEDNLDEIIDVAPPPVANFTFVAGDCNQTVWFNSSGSYDDPYGGITNYTWNFGDGTGEDRGSDNSSFSHTFPVTNGTYNVNLTVTDTDGLTNTSVIEVPVNREPSISLVNASKTSVAEPGEVVLFEGWYADPDGDTLTYRWVVDGVEIASGSSTNYSNASYFVNRTLTANLTISDPNGCTNTSSVNVTYLLRPIPVINFTAIGCLLVELNASNSSDPDGNITDYLWDAENGTIDDNTNVTCNATFSVGGNHTVRLNVTDNDGLTNTTTKVIYVSCMPTAAARANRTNVTAPGEMVLFDAPNSTCDMNVTNSLNYTWVINGTTYHDSSGEGIEHFVINTTTAFLTVTDEYNCTATDNVTVGCLYPPVVPVINFTAIGCLEVELNASGSYDPDGNITDYLWYAENGTIDNSTNVTCNATFKVGGNHTIRLNVTDNHGLTNSTTKVIYVACEPVAVAEANRTSLEFPGGAVLFNGSNSTYDPDSGPLKYTWDIGGHTYDNVSVSHYVTDTTTASLKVTDRYNCTDTANVTVIVHPIGEPVPAVTPIGMLALTIVLSAVGMRRVARRRSKFESS